MTSYDSIPYHDAEVARCQALADAAREKRRRDTYNAVWFELEREAARLFVAGEWPTEEVWVDLRFVDFDPYTLPLRSYQVRGEWTARTDEALRLHVEPDGAWLVRFEVRALTPLLGAEVALRLEPEEVCGA